MYKAVLQVLILVALGSSCVTLEVLILPTEYISFQSNVFTEGGYNIDQGIGSCTSSKEEVEGMNETVIICPQGELLTDGIKEANLGFSLSSTEIGNFYTWRERLLPVKDTFITLRFSDGAKTLTKVEVYCLVLRHLRIREPKSIELYSSRTSSVYPDTKIRGVDSSKFTVVDSGRTFIFSSNGGDDDNSATVSHYEYRKYSLVIPEDEQNSLRYLRLSLDFEGGNWMFVNEVEVYHEPNSPQESAILQETAAAAPQETVEPRGPTNSDQSSNSGTLTVVVVIAVGNVIGVFVCILIVFFGILYFRKIRKQNQSHPNEAFPDCRCPVSTLEEVLEENKYKKYDTSTKDYATASTGTSTTQIGANPLKRPKRKANLNSSLLETKLEVTNPILDTSVVTELNIYDDVVESPLTSRKLQGSDYYETYDYDKQDTDGNTHSYINMCVPIYDNPAPLTKSESPKLVEWKCIDVKGKIGEGQFGEIYLAKLNWIVAVDIGYKETNTTEILVAIKTLKGDYTASLKQQFEKEIKFMARLDNVNVIRLLGICNKGMPFIMIEYMKNGDLLMFLRKHYHPTTGKDIATAEIQVDIPILLYIALQIANGMRYLASYGFIHRDLAARNCLVGEDYVVKVADFGMTQNLYNTSYFVMQGTALVPIRWMAPESFFGRFSTKTDVWSYGVTLWEIFMLCRQQPYEEINDKELVLDVQKGPNRTLLKRPPIAPNEVYNTMTRCWRHNSTQRPDFESIYKQLLECDKMIH